MSGKQECVAQHLGELRVSGGVGPKTQSPGFEPERTPEVHLAGSVIVEGGKCSS